MTLVMRWQVRTAQRMARKLIGKGQLFSYLAKSRSLQRLASSFADALTLLATHINAARSPEFLTTSCKVINMVGRQNLTA